MDLQLARQFYAEEIAMAAHVRTAALVTAFSKVPREKFLGPGPWLIPESGGLSTEYWATPDADPRRVYHNILIALDPERHLNNGQPGSLAVWLDALELKPGGRVLHVGCGAGYYSAILAHTVGVEGRVSAVEVDAALAERARDNLADLPQVTVACADGWEFDAGTMDAIFINAGATHPNLRWLESLAPDGCLVVPLTATIPGSPIPSGLMLKVKRTGEEYEAAFISAVSIYALTTGRSDVWNGLLLKAMATRQWGSVRSLRLDAHDADESCYCHGDSLCISKRAIASASAA